jgi:hypothetical protein
MTGEVQDFALVGYHPIENHTASNRSDVRS